MMLAWLPFALGVVCLVLIPLATSLVRIRIRFFRWIGWNWGADLLENHLSTWVLFFRVMLVVVASLLFLIGFRQ